MATTNEISKAAQILLDGGLVAFPTETVYGLGADATQDAAVAKVYQTKSRPVFNPLIVHVPTVEAALALGQFNESSESLARKFWPGSLTLVVPRAEKSQVSLLASAGLPTVAIRVPAHAVALSLLKQVDRPVVAPSANLSGRISPTTAQHVRDAMGSAVDLVLDGGDCLVGIESTIVRVAEDGPYLLRAGGIASADIETVLQQRLLVPIKSDAPLAPGQLDSHYAPQAALRMDAEHPMEGELYLGFGLYSHGPYTLSATGDVVEAAANLFRMLHELDALNPIRIAVAPIPTAGLGEAINDRLRRAAAPRSLS